jgi:glycosyltransferase involved in cell wall biosynthesis
MRIGIDVRLDESGIGRYSLRLAEELVRLGGSEEYVLFARTRTFRELERLEGNVERRLADIGWYTVSEQLGMPRLLRSAGLDLVHFPHFNVPLVYRGPYVVTVHDLIHFLRRDLDTTRTDAAARPWKALPYRVVLAHAVRHAERVIAVSEATKRDIVDRLGVDPIRIAVTHEGVGIELPSASSEELRPDLGVRAPYFLYVGNAYPHKNLPRLLDAFARLQGDGLDTFQLVLAGNHGPYGSALAQLARTLGIEARVVFTGRVADAQLVELYRQAAVLVLVSLAEGFGLPGLEAMALGVPVLASRIDALTEIYGDAALYVDASDPEDIARGLTMLATNGGVQRDMRERGLNRVRQFSWRATAEATRQIYLECLEGRKRR